VFLRRGFSELGELFYGFHHGKKTVEHRRRGKEYIVNEAQFVAINNLRFNNNVYNNYRNLLLLRLLTLLFLATKLGL
jgi:hypothetical protein